MEVSPGLMTVIFILILLVASFFVWRMKQVHREGKMPPVISLPAGDGFTVVLRRRKVGGQWGYFIPEDELPMEFQPPEK